MLGHLLMVVSPLRWTKKEILLWIYFVHRKKELQRMLQPGHYELVIRFAQRKRNVNNKKCSTKSSTKAPEPRENLEHRKWKTYRTDCSKGRKASSYKRPIIWRLCRDSNFLISQAFVGVSFLVRKINNKFIVVELHNTSQRFSGNKYLIKGIFTWY